MKKIFYMAFMCWITLQACHSSQKVANTNATNSSGTNTAKAVSKKQEISKKGAWNEEDKKNFISSCEGEIMALKDTKDGQTIQGAGVSIEEFAKKSCDCAFKKVEKNYENVLEAGKDTEGLAKIGGECGGEAMNALMKK
ncbi:MAG: hypothetical protein MUC49_17580 [Raineya sp.]|jgi:hypothetical protein|nr:hypothetical protein [Raineya sp.]